MNQNWDYDLALSEFFSPGNENKVYTYLHLPSIERFFAADSDWESRIARSTAHCRRTNVGCLLPRFADLKDLSKEDFQYLTAFYQYLLKCAAKQQIRIGFTLEHAYEDYVIGQMEKKDAEVLCAKELVMRETLCEPDREITYHLHEGDLMSVVAFDSGERMNPEIVDLRSYLEGESDRFLRWKAPHSGNWVILEFYCRNLLPDDEDGFNTTADYLSYTSSYQVIERIYNSFEPTFSPFKEQIYNVLHYYNLSFDAPNHRNWTPSFNSVFEEKYGFDPSPYYPALFRDIGPESAHMRSLFFACRADMMQNGIFRAINDFAALHKMSAVGSCTEPKLAACSLITGDNIANNSFSPGALLDKAYLYGTNSVKIASSAAYNYDRNRVSCELYRDYYKIDQKIAYNDAMNSFARGANQMMVHVPHFEKKENAHFLRSLISSRWESNFTLYIARMQSMLSIGQHVSDIALLYPIYSLHANVNFYQEKTKKFEYPMAASSIDYMSDINSISTYIGHDLTVLHPKILNERCRVKDGVLCLENEHNSESFRIVILPASNVISLENLAKLVEFYDGGGKIIATGALPDMAFEFRPEEAVNPRQQKKKTEEDELVAEMIEHIFGSDPSDKNVIRPFCYNSNDRGGEAYFLPFSRTAADGTYMVKSSLLGDAIHSFDLPLDVYLPDMPRLECTGALNSVYPEFAQLGLVHKIPGGGMLNHIHKRTQNTDIYYFANTTVEAFDSYILLRGILRPEEWNPVTGEARPLPRTLVNFRETMYTKIPLKLEASESILIVSDRNHIPEDDEEEDLSDFEVTDTIDEIDGLD